MIDPNPEQLAQILQSVSLQVGVALHETYKHSCLLRRTTARIRRSGCCDAEQYLQLVASDQQEQRKLYDALMIHVSHFFRNPSLFVVLQQQILPDLAAQAGPGQHLQLWSLGCSSGEEPYSLAILLVESFAELLRKGAVSIVAADNDERTLQAARQGRYTAAALREVSDERRSRFFIEERGTWLVRECLRQLVQFRRLDLAQLASPGYPLDLLLCRNTLIYFNRATQEKILHRLADILRQDGILVLGKSETMPAGLRGRFITVDPAERIYRRR